MRWCNDNIRKDYLIHIIDTYEVQEVSIIPETISTGYFIINCTILNGSQAKGCAIDIFNNETMDLIFNQNIRRLSSTSSYAVDNISLSINGTYEIYIYVWDKYGRVIKSLVVMTKLVRVAIISYQGKRNENTSINGKYN